MAVGKGPPNWGRCRGSAHWAWPRPLQAYKHASPT